MVRPSPSVRLIAASVAACVGLAGCASLPPLIALSPYEAADGLNVEVADIQGLDLLLLTRGEGEPGVVTGTIVNNGDSAASVTISTGDASITLSVPARGHEVLGLTDGANALVVAAAPAGPGFLAEVEISVGGDAAIVPVPVLDDTFEQYAETLDDLDTWLGERAAADEAATSPPPSPSPSPSA